MSMWQGKVQNVHDNHKAKQDAQPHKVNHTFHFSIDWLTSYPLNQREQNVRAVKCWNWQDVEYRQVCRNKRNEHKKIGQTLRCISCNN